MEVTAEHLGRLYVFSLMWSVGALLEPAGRGRLELWLRSQAALALDLPPLVGTEDTMFDYYVASDGERGLFHSAVTRRNSDLQMANIHTHILCVCVHTCARVCIFIFSFVKHIVY